jgi:hypothetical protein
MPANWLVLDGTITDDGLGNPGKEVDIAVKGNNCPDLEQYLTLN